MTGVILPSFRPVRRVCPSLLILILITLSSISFITPINAQKLNSCNHGGGLWGTVVSTVEPINDTIQNKYNSLSDRGRFITGACVGFTASRVIVGSELCYVHFLCIYCNQLSSHIKSIQNIPIISYFYYSQQTATMKTIKTMGCAYIA